MTVSRGSGCTKRRVRLNGPLVVILVLITIARVSELNAQIGETERVVRQLSFEGNSALDDYTLSRAIVTSNSSFIARLPVLRLLPFGRRRRFDETDFRRDVLRLNLLYRQSGYAEVRIDTLVRRTADNVFVRIRIHEGEPMLVSELLVSGIDQMDGVRGLMEDLPLRVQRPFNRYLLKASVDSIRNFLRNRGYPHAQVFRNFDTDVERREVEVRLDAVPGIQARVGAIDIKGSNKVGTGVVRRTLALRESDLFSQRALSESQTALYRLNVYNFVDVALDTLVTPDDSIVSIVVRVAEGNFRRIRMGAGWGNVDCFRTFTNFRVDNFLGGGKSVDLTARLSKLGTQLPSNIGENIFCTELRETGVTGAQRDLNFLFSASLRFPYFISRRMVATLTASAEKRSELRAFVREEIAIDASLTRRFSATIPITFSYKLSNGRTEAEPATFCAILNVCNVADIPIFREERVRSIFGISTFIDRSNSVLSPSNGARIAGNVRWASNLIGSDDLVQFIKLNGEFAVYRPIGRRTVFAFRVAGGVVFSKAGSLPSSVERFVPPDERFYAGGPTTVRGFRQNGLGPVVYIADGDTTAAPTGGDARVIANAELRTPLTRIARSLELGIFVDAGQVISRGSGERLGDRVRITPGAGLRLTTPIGPVRLDVAYNPHDPEQGLLCDRDLNCSATPDYSPEPASGFLRRLTWNFAIGHAF